MSELTKFGIAMVIYAFLAPIAVTYIWDWCERRVPWYQNNRRTVYMWMVLSGPWVWLGAIYRWLLNDWKNYMTLREAQGAAREACRKSEGRFTYKDGRLVERALTAFKSRLLDRTKPYFWRKVPGSKVQAKLEVGDHAVDNQVISFICTRDTIINQLAQATALKDNREKLRWSEGLEMLNTHLEGWYQKLEENGQYVWRSNGPGGFGWCRVCNLKIRDCRCKTEQLPELSEALQSNPTSADS